MISSSLLGIITISYFLLLFAVAYYADRRHDQGRSLISNPNIYTLSLAVYATSWTFYGSIGRAATQGLDFLAIYLGPTLIIFSWVYLLRKIVRITKEQNIVSIADFISSRYGKSAHLGAIVTIFAVLGIMPYIALQLKAISHTFDVLANPAGRHGLHHLLPWLPLPTDTAFVVALVLAIFGILFGARHLDATERHEGLVAAIALESLIKLIAFLAAGLYVTYGLFNGMADIFDQFLTRFPERHSLLLLDTPTIPYPTWFTLTFIAMMAFMFLPRQFHIMVVENCDEQHIRKAMWMFPGYMFLLNLFVIPVALGGLILFNGDTSQADYFLLHLPLSTGQTWLALLVYIGGFSAAAGMVMVESVALATMILNHLIMPIILRLRIWESNISGLLINLKRLAILGVVFLGYVYYRIIGDSYALVNIGLISFIAATQFAPSVIGGLFWKRANRIGAFIGLLFGFILWFYTLLIPSFVSSGWMASDILERGLFGLSFLRPLALFGLEGFDMWTHSLFWTMFFNLGAFLSFSILTRVGTIDLEQAEKFVDVFKPRSESETQQRLSRSPSIMEFVELMAKFIGEKQAHAAIAEWLGDREIDERGSLSEYELPSLKRFTERTLAGSVGAAPARIIIENYLAARGSQMEDVFDIFGSVTISHTSSREQLGVLYETARVVVSGAPLQETLDNILEVLTNQFKFDLCVIRLLDNDRQTLTVRSHRGMTSEHLGESERQLDHDSYIGECFLSLTPQVVNDTDFTDKPKVAHIIHREGIKSFAHAPIIIEGEPIGVLSAFSRAAKGIFTKEFVELFQGLADQVGIAWRNSHQTQRLIEARSRERELEIAQHIQRGLLPDSFPTLPGIRIAALCHTAKQVGGDYYDFLPHADGSFDLVIADVSGHDIGAALMMAETRTFIQAHAQQRKAPAHMMAALNSFFFDDLTRSELFITMFYLSFDPQQRRLRYANAGHNRPLHWSRRQGRIETLDAEGLILGVKKQILFEERGASLETGDLLLLYTDGVTEAENQEGTFFGEERLAELLREHASAPPDRLIETIHEQLRLFTGSGNFNDDVSMVALQILEIP